jgi:hypothetical protein
MRPVIVSSLARGQDREDDFMGIWERLNAPVSAIHSVLDVLVVPCLVADDPNGEAHEEYK